MEEFKENGSSDVGTKLILVGGGLPIEFLLIQYTVIKETYYSLTTIGGNYWGTSQNAHLNTLKLFQSFYCRFVHPWLIAAPQDTIKRKTLEKNLIFSLKTLYPNGLNKHLNFLP